MRRVDAIKCHIARGEPLLLLPEENIELLKKPQVTGDNFQDAINNAWAKWVKEKLECEHEAFREIFLNRCGE